MNSRFLRVGRGETDSQNNKNDIQVNHPSVSRAHLEVFIDHENNVFITDLQTRNGTYVNGNPIVGDYKLAHGDILKIGSARPVQWKKWIEGNYESDQNSIIDNNNSSNPNISELTTVTIRKKNNPLVIAISVSIALIIIFVALGWFNSYKKNSDITLTENSVNYQYSKIELANKTYNELIDLAQQKSIVSNDVNDNDFIVSYDGKQVVVSIQDNRLYSVTIFRNPPPSVPNDQMNKKVSASISVDTTAAAAPAPPKKSSYDRDKDGVADANDQCPDEYGDINNYGCPASTTSAQIILPNSDGTYSMLSTDGVESVDHFIERIKLTKQDCQNPSAAWEITNLNYSILNENQRTNSVLPGSQWVKFKCY
jgi:pSer/pThr/pTyr-binding forkhead associated (FHA) protein